MSILDQLDAMTPAPAGAPMAKRLEPVAPGVRPEPGNLSAMLWGKKAPTASADLERILAIPRRTYDDRQLEQIVDMMTAHLRRERTEPCSCHTRNRPCIERLNVSQAWALYEIGRVGGMFAPIQVGGGKTALNFLAPLMVANCKTAVLLVPPGLVEQLKDEYLHWREHFRVPSFMVKDQGWVVSGAPAVHVVPYSRLSRKEATVLLDELDADTVIADEGDLLRNVDTARGDRFVRQFRRRPDTRFLVWSGSFLDSTIKDFAHLSGLALRERSPLPLDSNVVEDWAGVVDPPPKDQAPAPMGALAALCQPGESIANGFRRRLLETEGVVSTAGRPLPIPLIMEKRSVGVPSAIEDAIADVENTWMRPDGEEFTDSLAMQACARQLACGFYYRWIFPHGEPLPVIVAWFEARKNWAREVRGKLKRRVEHLDSPDLLKHAAMRYYGDVEHPDPSLPVWQSQCWPAWRGIKDAVEPETEAVWIDDYLAQDAAEWGLSNRGVVWYSYGAFGRRVAEISGLPLHAGGPKAEKRILAERGDRSIVASINSHGRGRNGLQYLFEHQLVANPPESKRTGGAARWEQLLGRLHREGQKAERVTTDIYRHTAEIRYAWDRAKEIAGFVQDAIGSYQKLLSSEERFRIRHRFA